MSIMSDYHLAVKDKEIKDLKKFIWLICASNGFKISIDKKYMVQPDALCKFEIYEDIKNDKIVVEATDNLISGIR